MSKHKTNYDLDYSKSNPAFVQQGPSKKEARKEITSIKLVGHRH